MRVNIGPDAWDGGTQTDNTGVYTWDYILPSINTTDYESRVFFFRGEGKLLKCHYHINKSII